MLTCIKGDGGRNARFAIKRFRYFHDGIGDLTELWKEKHGHLEKRKPKHSRRVSAPEGFKYCNGCEETLPQAQFSVDRSRRDGFNNRCKSCTAKNWKRANSMICERCGGECVGGSCRRCYTLGSRIRNAEWDALSIIPRVIYEANAPLRAFMRELAESNLSPQKRLKLLLDRMANGA